MRDPAGHLQHGGRTYVFCSLACLRRFVADTRVYTADSAEVRTRRYY
ncbi:hypothetical protein [Prauserella muralis]|nr:hypothetical protein [Prauserella muralis]